MARAETAMAAVPAVALAEVVAQEEPWAVAATAATAARGTGHTRHTCIVRSSHAGRCYTTASMLHMCSRLETCSCTPPAALPEAVAVAAAAAAAAEVFWAVSPADWVAEGLDKSHRQRTCTSDS